MKNTFRKELGKFVLKNKKFCLLIFLKNVFNCLNIMIIPFALKNLIIFLTETKDLKYFCLNVLAVVFSSILFICLANIAGFYSRGIQSKISTLLITELNQNTLNIDYEQFESSQAQDRYERSTQACKPSTGLIAYTVSLISAISYLTSFSVVFPFLLKLDILVIAVLAIVIIISIIVVIFQKKTEKNKYYNSTRANIRKINYINGIYNNVRFAKEMRIFSLDNFLTKTRDCELNNYYKKLKHNQFIKLNFSVAKIIIEAIEYIICYAYFIFMYFKNRIDISTFVYSISLVSPVIFLVNRIINFIGDLFKNRLYALDKINFENDFMMPSDKDLIKINEVKTVTFKNVSFKYNNSQKYALKNINLEIAKEKIAIVGLNGSGKTTLVKLLCGIYKPTEGTITINGIDISRIDKSSLFKNMDVLFQNSPLLATKLIDNVKFGNEENKELEKILEELNLSEKIKKYLTNEFYYSKELYDEGVELSGGEKAKILIMRVLLSSKNAFIMDEPTSALDAFAEKELYALLNEHMAMKSGIFITHRLNSVNFCDKIVVLDVGEIIETGTHKELINRQGKYRELFLKQSTSYKGAL